MEYVQPIREPKQIQAMKKILLAQSTRDHLLFVLGINSALRISDILKLRVGDVATNRNRPKLYYELREQKTGKARRFPFSKNVQKAITLYLEEKPEISSDDYLFRSRQGKGAISRQQAYRIINAAARSVGIQEKIGTHTLRKSFGYHAYKAGVDVSLLQSIFNHSSPSTTLRYIGITQDDMDDVIINLNL